MRAPLWDTGSKAQGWPPGLGGPLICRDHGDLQAWEADGHGAELSAQNEPTSASLSGPG